MSPNGRPATRSGSIKRAFIPNWRRMNASAGIDLAVHKRDHDHARLTGTECLPRQREVRDAVRGLVAEPHLPERVLRCVDEVVADDARGRARSRADDEHQRPAQAAAHAVDGLLRFDGRASWSVPTAASIAFASPLEHPASAAPRRTAAASSAASSGAATRAGGDAFSMRQKSAQAGDT